MADSDIKREVDHPIVPGNARCKLCKLAVYPAGILLTVRYAGTLLENPLAALDRRTWICRPCVDAIAAVPCVHKKTKRGTDIPRVYGSYRTEVCVACGMYRTMGHNGENPDPWRSRDAYLHEVTKILDARDES